MCSNSHKVFIFGQKTPQAGHNLVANSYEEMRAVLTENFECLRGGNFVLTEREDGTLVCDDSYYQLLQPNTELLVFIDDDIDANDVDGAGAGDHVPVNHEMVQPSTLPSIPTLQSTLESSNSFASNLRIANIMGNVPMALPSPPVMCDCCPPLHRFSCHYAPYAVTRAVPSVHQSFQPHPGMYSQPFSYLQHHAFPAIHSLSVPSQYPYMYSHPGQQNVGSQNSLLYQPTIHYPHQLQEQSATHATLCSSKLFSEHMYFLPPAARHRQQSLSYSPNLELAKASLDRAQVQSQPYPPAPLTEPEPDSTQV